jgi:L-lactate dehydrogenase
MKPIKTKVAVIGAGMVGATAAASLLDMDLIAEIALIDINIDRATGEALDLSHMTAFPFNPNVNIHSGSYDDCADAQIIVVTASAPMPDVNDKNGRMALVNKNIPILKNIMDEISSRTKDAILIFVSNPVDIMVYLAQNYFDYPANRIIGTGTLLDTARFRRILARNYLVNTLDVSGFILGEHGKTAFAAWSQTGIAGIPCENLDVFIGSETPFSKVDILNEVKMSGMEIILSKGFTNYGIAAAVRQLIQAIVLNELSILPVSTTFTGEYGIEDVAMSIPCIIGSNGIQRTVEIPLSDAEIDEYHASGNFIKSVTDSADLSILTKEQ